MTKLESSLLDLIDSNSNIFFDDVIVKRIFVVLYLSGDYVSLDEVASRASLSLASVSNKANLLSHLGMIEKTRKSGSKKIFLKAKTDFASLMIEKIRKKDESLKQLQKNVFDFVASAKKRSLSVEEKMQLKNLDHFGSELKNLVAFHEKVLKIIDNGI